MTLYIGTLLSLFFMSPAHASPTADLASAFYPCNQMFEYGYNESGYEEYTRYRDQALKADPKIRFSKEKVQGFQIDVMIKKCDTELPKLKKNAQSAGDFKATFEPVLEACRFAGGSDQEKSKEYNQKYQVAKAALLKKYPDAAKNTVQDAQNEYNVGKYMQKCEENLYESGSASKEDEYVKVETARRASLKSGCGVTTVYFEREMVAKGQYTTWRAAITISDEIGEPADCRSFPRKKSLGYDLDQDMKSALPGLTSDGVVVLVGSPKLETRVVEKQLGSGVVAEKQVIQTVEAKLYDTNMQLDTNPCFIPAKKLVCEESGSKGLFTLFSVQHYLNRAELHKKAGRPGVCQSLIEKATSQVRWWTETFAELKSSGKWRTGMNYKMKNNSIIPDTQFLAMLDTAIKTIQQREKGYCQ